MNTVHDPGKRDRQSSPPPAAPGRIGAFLLHALSVHGLLIFAILLSLVFNRAAATDLRRSANGAGHP